MCVVIAAGACGCDSCQKAEAPVITDAAPPPRFDKPPARADPRFVEDVLWKQAIGGDPMDLAALADQEGAPGLLEGLEQGGAVGKTALRAMPYADDAELGYQRLAEIAEQTEGTTQLELLQGIGLIAREAKARGEPLDPSGAEVCIVALQRIAAGKGERRNRLEAAAALRAFAYRGAMDPGKVPAVE